MRKFCFNFERNSIEDLFSEFERSEFELNMSLIDIYDKFEQILSNVMKKC